MSLEALLINTRNIRIPVVDKWNKKTFTVTNGVKCRVMFISKTIRTLKGEEVVSFAKIFFKKTQTVDPDMEIFIDGTWRPTIDTNTPQDSTEIHHKEIWVS